MAGPPGAQGRHLGVVTHAGMPHATTKAQNLHCAVSTGAEGGGGISAVVAVYQENPLE